MMAARVSATEISPLGITAGPKIKNNRMRWNNNTVIFVSIFSLPPFCQQAVLRVRWFFEPATLDLYCRPTLYRLSYGSRCRELGCEFCIYIYIVLSYYVVRYYMRVLYIYTLVQRSRVMGSTGGLGVAFFATGPCWVLKCISFWHSTLPYFKKKCICWQRMQMPNIIY